MNAFRLLVLCLLGFEIWTQPVSSRTTAPSSIVAASSSTLPTNITIVKLASFENDMKFRGFMCDNSNYRVDTKSEYVTAYVRGKVDTPEIPFETVQSPHRPWRYSPVGVAEVYTRNLTPKGFNRSDVETKTQWVEFNENRFRATYGSYT